MGLNHRYKIRMYESGDGDGCLGAGTILLPIDRSFILHCASLEEVEKTLRADVLSGKLQCGRVYQICPGIGNPEPIRSVAICERGRVKRVVLETARGLYSEFRRLRYSETATAKEETSLVEAVEA